MDVKAASDLKRVHHQLFPMNLFLEDEWLTEVSNYFPKNKKTSIHFLEIFVNHKLNKKLTNK